ncbi:hypothetical protein HPB51_021379 [Rhipicephalus microplus]|uniref:Uncharacterized protein n=1 Tax=Rhipicephalus microplus TaxID=6941 RepID=A0A9J6F821_RHIMP|nr:hypothetical protein HPB51_021379 [Rhipicephalus microplus]
MPGRNHRFKSVVYQEFKQCLRDARLAWELLECFSEALYEEDDTVFNFSLNWVALAMFSTTLLMSALVPLGEVTGVPLVGVDGRSGDMSAICTRNTRGKGLRRIRCWVGRCTVVDCRCCKLVEVQDKRHRNDTSSLSDTEKSGDSAVSPDKRRCEASAAGRRSERTPHQSALGTRNASLRPPAAGVVRATLPTRRLRCLSAAGDVPPARLRRRRYTATGVVKPAEPPSPDDRVATLLHSAPSENGTLASDAETCGKNCSTDAACPTRFVLPPIVNPESGGDVQVNEDSSTTTLLPITAGSSCH